MVSTLGFLDGITATLILLSATIFGLLSFYHARKLDARLLSVAGLTMFFVGLLWFGPFVDFILIMTTGKNLHPIHVYAWLSYMWVAPALVCAMYLGSELMMPEKKKVIVGIFIVLGVIFEYFLWFDTLNAFTFTLDNPGQDTIDSSFVRTHPTFIFIALFLVSALFFLGIGFAIKAKQATGELRKKFAYLSLGFTIFVVCGALDSIIPPGIAIGFSRGIMATFALWMYLGLKT